MTVPDSDRLKRDGKPLRALRVLAKAVEPMYEDQVYSSAKRGYTDTAMWHNELRKLCLLGYAERSGPRGGYRYAITEAGRTRLASDDQELRSNDDG